MRRSAPLPTEIDTSDGNILSFYPTAHDAMAGPNGNTINGITPPPADDRGEQHP
jgi:hypothetical protein